jgi:electron transport complex protein RnfE
MTQYKQILKDGLWDNNPGLIQFLGICPLLAVSNSLINGIGLGIATLTVLMLSNLTVSLIRPLIAPQVRLPIFVLIIASLVTCVELLTKGWFFDLWLSLGIFLPLIVTNCVILARAESFASKQGVIASLADGLAHGLGFALILMLLGGLREIVGTGSLFADGQILFGAAAAGFELKLFDSSFGFLLALLPPGAFLGLAFLIALRNILSREKHPETTGSNTASQPPVASESINT